MTDISKEYASALFDLAIESHTEEETLTALHMVRDAVNAAPGSLDMLASPAIPKKERLAMLEQAWGKSTPPAVMGFLNVLCSNGHIRSLMACIDGYEELYNTAKKLSTAYVTSAVALTDGEKQTLRQKLEKRLGRTIQLVCREDSSLLGGLMIEVDGKVIDGSLKKRLHEIKEVMNA